MFCLPAGLGKEEEGISLALQNNGALAAAATAAAFLTVQRGGLGVWVWAEDGLVVSPFAEHAISRKPLLSNPSTASRAFGMGMRHSQRGQTQHFHGRSCSLPLPQGDVLFLLLLLRIDCKGGAEEPLFGRLSFKFLAVGLLRPSLSYILVTSLDLLWLSGLHSFSLRFFAIPQEALFAFLQYRDELLPLKQIITKRAF